MVEFCFGFGSGKKIALPLIVLKMPPYLALKSDSLSAAVFLIDVSSAKIEAIALITQAAKLRSSGEFNGSIVAFGPHVEREKLQQARDAGADEVLTRGHFDHHLDELLISLAGRA